MTPDPTQPSLPPDGSVPPLSEAEIHAAGQAGPDGHSDRSGYKTRDEISHAIGSMRTVLWPDGSESAISEARNIKDFPGLRRLIEQTEARDETGTQPEAVKLVESLGLASPEPFSDRGHFRYFPKGALLRSLIRELHEQLLTRELGAMELRTPYLYDWKTPKLREEAGSFSEELYYVSPPAQVNHRDRRGETQQFVLRFGGDFGLFSLLADAQLTYRHLPARVYELADSFRYERSGSLRGIQRARSFSFLDIHSICSDPGSGLAEYGLWFQQHISLAQKLGFGVTPELTVVKSYYEQNREAFQSMVRAAGGPVVLDLISDQKHYWVSKYMMYDDHGQDLFNNQLDFDNGSRFNVTYVGSDGGRHPCVLCHASLGSFERWLLHYLDQALSRPVPTLDLWLSPTHIRFVPVSSQFVPAALKLAEELNIHGIRADVEDRNGPLGKKLKFAKADWVPYVIVFGQREQDNRDQMSIRSRLHGQSTGSLDALVAEIKAEIGNLPYRPFLPLLLSRRPKFQ